MVLWTGKSADELLKDESIICARMPPLESPLFKLVTDHQVHKCNINYCNKGDPEASCRFGYPKPIIDEAMFDNEDHAMYRRGAADIFVNPYSPLLLALFETNMDIQVSVLVIQRKEGANCVYR
jgi:hypothetical protein